MTSNIPYWNNFITYLLLGGIGKNPRVGCRCKRGRERVLQSLNKRRGKKVVFLLSEILISKPKFSIAPKFNSAPVILVSVATTVAAIDPEF
jgi:hypothetical protein